jgi:hypothetical protein
MKTSFITLLVTLAGISSKGQTMVTSSRMNPFVQDTTKRQEEVKQPPVLQSNQRKHAELPAQPQPAEAPTQPNGAAVMSTTKREGGK